MRTTRKNNTPDKQNYGLMRLKLWLKTHKINKAGTAPISLRITIGGKRAEFSTDIRVRPGEWDQVHEQIIGTSRAVAKNNDTLEEIKADARQAKKELPVKDRTAANVAKKMRGEAPAPTVCLLEKLEQVLASHYRQANQDTLANFERAAVLLTKWHNKKGPLDKEAFTVDAQQRFVSFLLLQMTPAGVRTYLTALVSMWSRAGVYRPGEKPFVGVKLPKHSPKEKASLSKEQLDTLAGGALPELQHHARNLYRACFYLHGSRISAVLQLRWRDYDGERIEYQAMKHGPLKKVKVRPELAALLEQYRPAQPAPDAFIFPYLPADFFSLSPAERYAARKRAVAKVNFHLKHACRALGLPTNIHPHTARHTMARITVEATNGDIRAAQHVIGHTTYQQTEEYVRGMLTTEIDVAADAAYDLAAGRPGPAPALVEQLRAALQNPAIRQQLADLL